MKKFDRYKQNLRQHNDEIWSYSTMVAIIKDDYLIQLGYWSVTTQKHINYVAREYDLKLVTRAEYLELYPDCTDNLKSFTLDKVLYNHNMR